MIKTFEEFKNTSATNEGLVDEITDGLDLGKEIVETCKKFKKANKMKNEDLKSVLESIVNNIDATFEGEDCDDEDEKKKKEEKILNDDKEPAAKP